MQKLEVESNFVWPKDILRSAFTFNAGGVVPDRVPLSEISLKNHPSNIEIFRAANFAEASGIAKHAFLHGKHGALWLADSAIPFQGDGFFSKLMRHRKVKKFIEGIDYELVRMKDAGDIESFSTDYRCEKRSSFDLHVDDRIHDMPQNLRVPAVEFFRAVFNMAGLGTILFGRNILVAEKLQSKAHKVYERIEPEELGQGYICPAGSVLFIRSGTAGLSNCLLHSPPEDDVIKAEGLVREAMVVDCFFKHPKRFENMPHAALNK